MCVGLPCHACVCVCMLNHSYRSPGNGCRHYPSPLHTDSYTKTQTLSLFITYTYTHPYIHIYKKQKRPTRRWRRERSPPPRSSGCPWRAPSARSWSARPSGVLHWILPCVCSGVRVGVYVCGDWSIDELDGVGLVFGGAALQVCQMLFCFSLLVRLDRLRVRASHGSCP